MARGFVVVRRRIYAEQVAAEIKALGVDEEETHVVSQKLGVSWMEAALLLAECSPRAIAVL
jgi:hypothetical protein